MGTRTDYARHERVGLCEVCTARGPDAATLCEGWHTRDLLQHLVLREWRTVPVRIRRGGAEASRVAGLSWPELIEQFRAGPPRGSFFLLPGVEGAANLEEYFIHHEDVRRASPGWQRRVLPEPMEAMFWRWLRSPFGRIIVRRSPVGVHVQRPEGDHAMLRRGRPGVVVRGLPSEVLLYLFGRRAVAEVDLRGPAVALQALATARLGM